MLRFVTMQYLRGRTKNKQTAHNRTNKYGGTMRGPARHNKAVAFVPSAVNHTVL